MLSRHNITASSAGVAGKVPHTSKLPSARNGTRVSKSTSSRDSSGTLVESCVSFQHSKMDPSSDWEPLSFEVYSKSRAEARGERSLLSWRLQCLAVNTH